MKETVPPHNFWHFDTKFSGNICVINVVFRKNVKSPLITLCIGTKNSCKENLQEDIYTELQNMTDGIKYNQDHLAEMTEDFTQAIKMNNNQKACFYRGSVENSIKNNKFKCDLPIFFAENSQKEEINPTTNVERKWLKNLNLENLITKEKNQEIKSWYIL